MGVESRESGLFFERWSNREHCPMSDLGRSTENGINSSPKPSQLFRRQQTIIMQTDFGSIVQAQLTLIREAGAIEKATVDALESIADYEEDEKASAKKRILKMRDSALLVISTKAEHASKHISVHENDGANATMKEAQEAQVSRMRIPQAQTPP